MTRVRAAVGSALFLLLAPGVVVGLIPWWLSGWDSNTVWAPVRVVGATLILAGVSVLLHAFARFVLEGIGTPAPVAPTQHLVVGGLYRYVRNPMYMAVIAAIAGQALLLGRVELLIYATLVAAAVASFVHWYEEPTLRRQFGAEYEAYCEDVPAWIPRFRR